VEIGDNRELEIATEAGKACFYKVFGLWNKVLMKISL
jgi:hypothetical protein